MEPSVRKQTRTSPLFPFSWSKSKSSFWIAMSLQEYLTINVFKKSDLPCFIFPKRRSMTFYLFSFSVTDDNNLFLMKTFDFPKFINITQTHTCSCLEVEGDVKYSENITCGNQSNCSKPDIPVESMKRHARSKRTARSLFTYVPRKMKQTLKRRKVIKSFKIIQYNQ